MVTQQRTSLSHLTGTKGSHAAQVKRQRSKCSAGVGGQTAKHAFEAFDQILLPLVGHIGGNLGADGSHGVSAGGKGSQVTSLKGAATVQDHANLLVSGDFARRQRGAIRQHFKVAGQVGLPEGDVDVVTTLGSVQLSHGLHHTGCQEGITQGGLLNDVRRENLGDDDIRAKSRHDETSGD